MLSKEQIAHDLAMAYINNRYGIDVTGTFSVNSSGGSGEPITDVIGSGDVKTTHFQDVNETKKVKVGTGEKGFLGFEKKKWVDAGYSVDEIFVNMIEDYYKAYSRFFELLNNSKQ